jgi:hypothetical protein
MFPQAIIIIAYASHCQIDYQISFDNYHLNFRDVKTRQNLISPFDKLCQRRNIKLTTTESF